MKPCPRLNSLSACPPAALRGSTLIAFCLLASALCVVSPARAVEDRLFAEKVRPVLEARCYKCHSHSSGKSKGGLLLDSRAAMLQGGDDGPALVPGKPQESLIVKAIEYEDEKLQMPPKGQKLSGAEIAAITEWVKSGAPWPGDEAVVLTERARGKITDEDRKWWAFQPLHAVEPPRPAGTAPAARNPIDQFTFARLAASGLTPSPEAPRAVLIRRVTFDLTGLPPAPSEVDAFLADPAPDAYERVVDRLLASPRYGERMSRAWLDLVRYADSDGYRIDDYRPDAWHYRDYVIRALNSDKPYDRFVQEQLAGDELFPGDPEALIATGYLRHWIYEYNSRDVRGQWTTILNDLTDTTGDVFLGLGVQCARCHDHKFDPILQKDYYRLQAYFAPILPRHDLIAATSEEKAAHAAKLAAWEEKTASIRDAIASIEGPHRDKARDEAVGKFPEEIQAMIRKPVPERTPLEHQLAELAYRQVTYEYGRLDGRIKGTDKERLLALRRQLAEFDKDKPAPLPVAFAATDCGPDAPPVFIPKKPKEAIEPGVPSVLDEAPARVERIGTASTGRRAALARWLVEPGNPLTARVMVNRVWQLHFGRGLAANASDFGKLGEAPSHPELLDWLAANFVKQGWSMKGLHRLIVTSATYRQASEHPSPQAARMKDPEDRLLWRMKPRRLEAEEIRDALFAASGELRLDRTGGPGVQSAEPVRSIFTRIMRNTRDPLSDVFDAPLWFTSASLRDVTTTPVQSLLLVNSPFMLQRGHAFAAHVEKLAPGDETGQVRAAVRIAFGRDPTDAELQQARAFLARQAANVDPLRASSAQAAFVPDKIPYRDGQAALVDPDGAQQLFRAKASADLAPTDDFTIEAYFLLRSVYDSGKVRTIAAQWSGALKEPGWSVGVTGQRSRRKPLTLVFQSAGQKRDGTFGEVAAFSDQNIQLNKPYFFAAAVKLATPAAAGLVTFYLKDLSNDDEPLLVARVEHDLVGGLATREPFTIGGRSGPHEGSFHGSIDDVRLSHGALGVGQILFNGEGGSDRTAAWWRFEPKPDVFHDSSGHGHDLEPTSVSRSAVADPRHVALADFCHALLNSSEFLYTE